MERIAVALTTSNSGFWTDWVEHPLKGRHCAITPGLSDTPKAPEASPPRTPPADVPLTVRELHVLPVRELVDPGDLRGNEMRWSVPAS